MIRKDMCASGHMVKTFVTTQKYNTHFHRHPELVRRDWVKPGAVVVDVGINVVMAPPPVAAGQVSEVEVLQGTGSEAEAQQATGQPQQAAWTPGTYHVVGDVAFDEVSEVSCR